MAEDNRNKEQSALSRAASAAGTARSALKTGKAVAGAAKGAAAGPYGMLAAGLWENRKAVGKVLAALAVLLMLPVLFILMLPSLIFGNLGLDDAAGDALNDNSVIMENIAVNNFMSCHRFTLVRCHKPAHFPVTGSIAYTIVHLPV